MQSTNLQALTPTTPISLYPTLGSLQEVIDLADSRISIENKNVVLGLLLTYHNTLLNQINLGH